MSVVSSRAVRNTLAACRAALRQDSEVECAILLVTGKAYGFKITDLLDDALIGHRVEAPGKVTIVPLSALAMIEFG